MSVQPAVSHAANQGRPGINLGLTSFYDGFGRPKDGFTFQAYLHYAHADTFFDSQGNESRSFRDPRFDVYLLLTQLTYSLPNTIWGGRARPAINFVLPILGYGTSFGTPGVQLTQNGAGIGDLSFGPVLQFMPIMKGGRPFFSQRFEVDLFVPTGRYNPDYNINQGTNYLSLNPYWSATILPHPDVEISTRLNYIYNFTNERPLNAPVNRSGGTPVPLEVESARTGHALWLNFAASYQVTEGVHLGINGYLYKQVTRDQFHLRDGTVTDGRAFGEGKQRVIGLGPGVFWEARKTDRFYANMVFPMAVEARWAWSQYQVRWLHSFP